MMTHIAEIFENSTAGGIFMILFLIGMTALMLFVSKERGYIEPAMWVFLALDVYMCLPVEHLVLLQILILIMGIFMVWAGYKWGLIIPILWSGKKFYQSPGKIVLALFVVGLPGFAVFQGIQVMNPKCEYRNCREIKCAESEHYCKEHSYLDSFKSSKGSVSALWTKDWSRTETSTGSRQKKCLCSGCDRPRMSGGLYCVRHTCAKSGCFQKKYNGNFCRLHRLASYTKSRGKSRDPEDYDVEGYYDDNRSDYDDYDDAYEGFEDDPDEWDYYD